MRILITGATGMVGKGVLLEAIDDPRIEQIVLLTRKSTGIESPKIIEILHANFLDLKPVAQQIQKIDACFHSMGVSSIGLNETQFNNYTFQITKGLADLIHDQNPNAIMNYVSGTGTDASELGKTMWARVKGKTENYILNKGFKDAYMFRPGIILPEKGIKSRTQWYSVVYMILTPFFPLLKKSKNVTTTTAIGKAMLNTLFQTQELKHLENSEINKLANLI